MALKELRKLYAYNRWANLRMLDALEELTDAELGRDLKSSFPNLAATLVHLLDAEWVWLERWNGRSPTDFPDGSAMTSVHAVRDRWDLLWRDQQAFLEGLDERTVARPVSYRTFAGDPQSQPLPDLMRHVVNHATYHRGQLVTMLRQLGKTPPSTDYVRYLREEG